MHGFRTHTDTITEAETAGRYAQALLDEVEERAGLLGPVARHTATDGENASVFLHTDEAGVGVEIEVGVEGEALAAAVHSHKVAQREVEPHLRVGERRYKDWDVVSVGTLEHRALFGLGYFIEVAAELTQDVFGVNRRAVGNLFHNLAEDDLGVVEILLEL